MLSKVRVLAVALIVLAPYVTKLSAETHPPAPYVTPQMLELIVAHRGVLERMNTPDEKGKPLRIGQAQMTPLLKEGWQFAGQWAAAWLDLHPSPSARELENIFVDFTPPLPHPEVYDPKQVELFGLQGSATRIAVDVYVVTAVYENNTETATGTFFVAARGADGHFYSEWSVKPLAERHYRLKDEIGRWAFLGSCVYYCGPLVVSKIIVLPPSEKGQPRFAIDAFQATNGNTLMKQLGVWQWNGTEAENLAIRSYEIYIDEDREIQLVGNLLTVPTKETTRSFSSFGCCAEPRGIWVLRVTPKRVQDLGHRFLQRQIEWADRLLATSRAKSPAAADIAAPSVLAFIQRDDIDGLIVDQCHVLSHGRKGSFEISFGEGTKLWLAYRLRNGQPYFTKIRVQ